VLLPQVHVDLRRTNLFLPDHAVPFGGMILHRPGLVAVFIGAS